MQPPTSARAHGGVRGADLSRSSLLFGGPFGRVFRAVPPADYGHTDAASLKNLDLLAEAMLSSPDDADPKDGPDNEESGIPAAFTYLGQFIDHDLTFDPASSLQKQNDPDALEDYRTPQFDLDNLYGRGPDDQPYMYDVHGRSFVLGKHLNGAEKNPEAQDLQRNSQDPARAMIGDPRNDENVIVSQLQGLWQRFHNKLAAHHPEWSFPKVQQEVRFHYQWILIHDFLPTIVSPEAFRSVLPLDEHNNPIIDIHNLKFFHFKNFAFMPLEFSAAAYRYGHSMIRPGYRLNDGLDQPLAIFDDRRKPAPDGKPRADLRGFKAPHDDWAIDWRRFIDLEELDYGFIDPESDEERNVNKTRLQLAYRIDTSIVNPLGHLPKSIAFDPNMLAKRNLERGFRMRLPNGQSIARAMGLKPLDDSEIIIGKFDTGDPKDIKFKSITEIGDRGAFVCNCPLWTYVLAETVLTTREVLTKQGPQKIPTRQLGPVGGRIVAETFIGLLLADSSSYVSLDPLWRPAPPIARHDGTFGLREMIKYVLA